MGIKPQKVRAFLKKNLKPGAQTVTVDASRSNLRGDLGDDVWNRGQCDSPDDRDHFPGGYARLKDPPEDKIASGDGAQKREGPQEAFDHASEGAKSL